MTGKKPPHDAEDKGHYLKKGDDVWSIVTDDVRDQLDEISKLLEHDEEQMSEIRGLVIQTPPDERSDVLWKILCGLREADDQCDIDDDFF